MQSPLLQLLDLVGSQTLSVTADLDGAIGEASHLLSNLPIYQDVEDLLLQSGVQGCVADASHVNSCRERGSQAFMRGQVPVALSLYSEALRYCDETTQEGCKLAARLYCNRALCLLRQAADGVTAAAAATAAADDAASASACDPEWDKAYYRYACAQQALGNFAAALAAAQRALALAQEQQQGGSTAELQALVTSLEAQQAAQRSGAENHANGLPNGHAAAASASSSSSSVEELVRAVAPRVSMQLTDAAGRGLAAAAALEAGQDVLRERPFVHVLTKQGRRSACAVCCKPLAEAPAPYYCRRCPMACYCSRSCREADEWHVPGGAECGACGGPWTVLLPPDAVLAVRLARRLQREPHAPGAQLAASLETHFADLVERDPTAAAQQAALAVLSTRVWRAASERDAAAGSSSAAAGGNSARSLQPADVLAALCRVQVNGVAIAPLERAGAEHRTGLAVYAVSSLLNHACIPTVAVRFEGCTLVARTLRSLAAGEAALHCYGPQAGEMVAAQRQRLLRDQYFFDCACPACSDVVGGAAAEARLVGLRCPRAASAGCDGAAVPPGAQPPGLVSLRGLHGGGGACSTCGAPLDEEVWRSDALPQLQQAASSHTAALEAMERLGPEASSLGLQPVIRVLRDVLRQRQRLLHPHNQLLGATHDALAQAWNAAGAPAPAAQHLRHSLSLLQRAYPAQPPSTAVAFQQRQLAHMLQGVAAAGGSGSRSQEPAAEAAALLCEARETLALHFGPEAAAALVASPR